MLCVYRGRPAPCIPPQTRRAARPGAAQTRLLRRSTVRQSRIRARKGTERPLVRVRGRWRVYDALPPASRGPSMRVPSRRSGDTSVASQQMAPPSGVAPSIQAQWHVRAIAGAPHALLDQRLHGRLGTTPSRRLLLVGRGSPCEGTPGGGHQVRPFFPPHSRISGL